MRLICKLSCEELTPWNLGRDERIFNACKPSNSMYTSTFNSFHIIQASISSYEEVLKMGQFLEFWALPWGCHWRYRHKTWMKEIQCLQNISQHVHIIFNRFRVPWSENPSISAKIAILRTPSHLTLSSSIGVIQWELTCEIGTTGYLTVKHPWFCVDIYR